MAGQGIQRRQILKILGTAASAAQFPGFSKWAFACGHVGNARVQVKPAEYRPQFFTSAEYASIERVADIILPNDGTPGALDAGVPEFIDFMVSADPSVQYAFRTGLATLDAYAEQTAGKKFMELTREQQTSLLEPLGFKAKFKPGMEEGRQFFHLVREFTVTGFYTSEIGFKELDNPALKFYSESPECPHKGDPEHLHLPPPKY